MTRHCGDKKYNTVNKCCSSRSKVTREKIAPPFSGYKRSYSYSCCSPGMYAFSRTSHARVLEKSRQLVVPNLGTYAINTKRRLPSPISHQLSPVTYHVDHV